MSEMKSDMIPSPVWNRVQLDCVFGKLLDMNLSCPDFVTYGHG